MRPLTSVVFLASLFFVSGCSVFGIATRGDLEAERSASRARVEQMRDENRILRSEFERLRATVDAARADLSDTETLVRDAADRATAQRQQIWSQVGDLQMRLAGVEDGIGQTVSLSDSLRGEFARTSRAAQAASTEALTVRQDLDVVSDRAELAVSRSDVLLEVWLERLRSERARLRGELDALEASLSQWESEVFEDQPTDLEPSAATSEE